MSSGRSCSGSSASSRHHYGRYSQILKEPLAIRHSSSLESQKKERSERLTPRQFLDKYSLPRVVQVVTDNERSLLGPLAQPLLLFKHYKSTKVQSRTLPSLKVVTQVGPSLVIPDSYQGWFSLVTSQGQVTAQCYTCIEQLVLNRITAFLTKHQLVAYKLNDSKGTVTGSHRLQYVKTYVAAGRVVKLLAVFEDVTPSQGSSHSHRRLSFSAFSRGLSGYKRYVQCVNHKNQMVFIPLNTTGQFYAVSYAQDEQDDLRMLYQVPQLLSDYRLPLKVHLVSGSLPSPRPPGFTGNLMLDSYQEEDVILACTLPSNPSAIQLLEMDADSKFLLSRPLYGNDTESRMFKSPSLQNALAFCRDKGEIWRRQIKVTHHIFPTFVPLRAPPRTKENIHYEVKLGKNQHKPKRFMKKSSSFIYTSLSSKVQSELPAISHQSCELVRVTSSVSTAEQLVSIKEDIPIARVSSAGAQRYHRARVASEDDIPYGRVVDDVENFTSLEADENIYAEICDGESGNTNRHNKQKYRYLCLRTKCADAPKEDYYYVQLEGSHVRDNEPTYDTVC